MVFVALAQPLVPVLNGEYGDHSPIRLAATASVLLPLIVVAGLSQFSAAMADTLSAAADLKEARHGRVVTHRGFLVVKPATIVLA